MGEVAAKLRVGVNHWMSQEITPPRRVPTLPIKGRVFDAAASQHDLACETPR
jgi:hypothetical protein